MLRLRKISIQGLLVISALLFLFNTAQAAENEPVTNTESVNAASDQKESAEPQKDIAETYVYDPTGMTDPFKSFIVVREEVKKEEEEKPKTYLETLALSQLTLSVIVISPKGRWAMVRDSKGEGHVIREGTPIGTSGGVVHKISEGEVIIREEFTNFRGEKEFRDISKKTPVIR